MSAQRTSGVRHTRREWRANAVLTALLCLALVFFGNRVAREHLAVKRDLSEDQLFAPSDVGLRLVRDLEDLVQVRAFFTGDVKSGVVQIAKRRLMDQLDEYVEASDGLVQLAYVDPNESSEAMAEANALGIPGVPIQRPAGSSVTTQNVWLGIVLRYRGRELVLPWVLPQIFEFAFLGGIHKLTRDADVTVGFLVHGGQGEDDEFADVRGLLVGQYRLREVLDLELGDPVPDDVSVLVVARPIELHPRAVFAIDQFIQRGGRVLFLVDRVIVDLAQARVAPVTTGLEDALDSWGVGVSPELVWDVDACNRIPMRDPESGRQINVPFPVWPFVDQRGLDATTPVTAQMRKADFFWAHPVGAERRAIEGLERTDLAWSSDLSWRVDASRSAVLDPASIQAQSTALVARGDPDPSAILVALSGRFPTAFSGGAPQPYDAVDEALFAGRVERAREAGEPLPERVFEATSEDVLDRAAPSQVVVVGDADWATSTNNGKFLTLDNKLLFVSLVDWLALADDLIALRARVPVPRQLDDFLDEERRARGLVGPRVEVDDDSAQRVARIETEAEEAAAARRVRSMSIATGGALGLTLAFGLLWRFAFRRTPRRRAPTEESA